MKMLLAALLLMHSAQLGIDAPHPRDPTIDLSAIRSLECTGPEGDWVGSGFLIGDHILATALHVAKNTVCTDAATGGKLLMYKEDDKHDLALLTGPTLPTNIPYVHYNCQRFIAGNPYLSYGITFYDQPRPIARMNTIYATAGYSTDADTIEDKPSPGLRIFNGFIAPGMSGGPVIGLDGYAHAVNNAGSDEDTMLYEFADGMLCQ